MVSFVAVVIAGSLLNPIVIIIGSVAGVLLGSIIKTVRNWFIAAVFLSGILAVCLAYAYASSTSPFDYRFDQSLKFDSNYSPWADIDGTIYQDFADSFVGAHNAAEVRKMKRSIDQRERDCRVLLVGTVADVNRGINPISGKPLIYGKPWFQLCNALSFRARAAGFYIIILLAASLTVYYINRKKT